MRKWLIGQFYCSSERKCRLKVGCLFVMGCCDNSPKVVSLKEYCLHCTGPIQPFKTNFGLE